MNGTALSAPSTAHRLASTGAAGAPDPGAAGASGSGAGRPRRADGGGHRPVIAATLLLLAVASVVPSWLYYRAIDQPVPWSRLASEALSWVLWLALLPAIAWASRRFRVDRGSWPWAVPVHIAIGIGVIVLYTLLVVVKNQAILALGTGLFAPGFLRQLPNYLVGGFQSYLVVYGSIAVAVHAVDGARRLREREISASRLEADLSRAQLKVLKMQLEPHFLFNTLNAISALVHTQPDGAERMVIRLSELLRMSLSATDRDQVPLEEDLRFLATYLDIQRTRFGDRLKVEIDVPEALRSAAVPNLLLQPLVENSIRHGLEKRSAPLAVHVRARQGEDRRLVLEIEDDGPGLPASGPRKDGVGLANTRARLEQLYGEAARFEIGNRAEGGARIHLEIPQLPTA